MSKISKILIVLGVVLFLVAIASFIYFLGIYNLVGSCDGSTCEAKLDRYSNVVKLGVFCFLGGFIFIIVGVIIRLVGRKRPDQIRQ